MRIITLVTQKGGTGKTTRRLLAVAAQEAGEKVLALGPRPPSSLATWGELREADLLHVEKVPAGHCRPALLLDGVKGQGFTLTIIDTAGADNPTTHIAMQTAELCLVPIRPTWSTATPCCPPHRPCKRFKQAVRVRADVRSAIPRNSRAAEMAAGLKTLGVLAEPNIAQRADHQDAHAGGAGRYGIRGRRQAAEEVRALWQWVDKRMKGKTR